MQVRRYVISGELTTAIGETKPESGSDVKGIRTTARRDGSFHTCCIQRALYSTRKSLQRGKLVPEVRFELTHPQGRRILNPLRLPFRHSGTDSELARFEPGVNGKALTLLHPSGNR